MSRSFKLKMKIKEIKPFNIVPIGLYKYDPKSVKDPRELTPPLRLHLDAKIETKGRVVGISLNYYVDRNWDLHYYGATDDGELIITPEEEKAFTDELKQKLKKAGEYALKHAPQYITFAVGQVMAWLKGGGS